MSASPSHPISRVGHLARARAPALFAVASLCAAGCVDDSLQEPTVEEPIQLDSCAAPSPHDLAGWEPDESCPNLDAIVGEEAVATFVRHRELRARGVDPEVAEDTEAAPGITYAVTLRTVYGYVRDHAAQPIAGVRVQAFDADDLDDDDFMGDAITNAAGYFEIHYDGGHWDPCPHEWVCWRPDIYVAVSSRQWVNHGSVYAGNWDGLRPKCSNLEYAWQPVAFSSERSDWRLSDPLRIDVLTPPREAIWEDPGDRPPCLNDTFCYTFTSVHTECFGFVERLQGCTTTGQQYEWFAPCLFVASDSPVGFGTYDLYVSGIQKCFSEPLSWPPASCTRGASLQPVDPQPSFLTATALD
jgi:hypothetical protein